MRQGQKTKDSFEQSEMSAQKKKNKKILMMTTEITNKRNFNASRNIFRIQLQALIN